MKTCYIFCLLFSSLLLISCNVYESEAHKLINSNGGFQNSKIVLSANDSFSESFCYPNKNIDEVDNNLILTKEGSTQNFQFKFYVEPKDPTLSVNLKAKQNLLCIFKLKDANISKETETLLLDYSIATYLEYL